MEPIRNFNEMTARLRQYKPQRVAAVEAYDEHSFDATLRALKEGFASVIYVGDVKKMECHQEALKPYADRVTLVDSPSVEESAAKAVKIVREGGADVIMKGIINTDVILRAILNKEWGLLRPGRVLSHVSVMKNPAYDKLMFVSDVAVIPNPNLEQRIQIIRYCTELCHSFGIEQPRVALIHCTEKVSPKFPITLDYETIKQQAAEGQLGNLIVDGPLDLKCAVDHEAALTKGINSPLEGRADVIVVPDIEAGNVFYKTMTTFSHTELAVGLVGADCPVCVTSRADSAETKFNSLALACLSAAAK